MSFLGSGPRKPLDYAVLVRGVAGRCQLRQPSSELVRPEDLLQNRVGTPSLDFGFPLGCRNLAGCWRKGLSGEVTKEGGPRTPSFQEAFSRAP